MSHQGINGWFPECLICGMGNLPGMVCLDPSCHEFIYESMHEPPAAAASESHQKNGHDWKTCAACQNDIRCDGGAWGTYGICTDCLAVYFRARRLPPASPAEVSRHLSNEWLHFSESR